MAPEPIQQWSVDNVCTWLTAIGLGSKAEAFKDNGVDGSLLCTLSTNDLTSDLSLSGIQAKKVLLEIEFAQGLGSGGGADPVELEALQSQLAEKDAKIAELEKELAALKNPAPQHHAAPPPPPRREHNVVKGAAGECRVCSCFFSRTAVRFFCFLCQHSLTTTFYSNPTGGAAKGAVTGAVGE